jgi:hypothetical protein
MTQGRYLEDPSLFGTRGRVPLRTSVERWHDDAHSGGSPPEVRERRWLHLGIFIREGAAGKREPTAFTDVK